MPSTHKTLYFRLSVVLLGVVTLLSTVQFLFFTHYWDRLGKEAEQRVNLTLAEKLALPLSETLRHGINRSAVESAFFQAAQQYPKIDLYLVNAEGRILVSSVESQFLKSSAIDMEPVRHFLANEDTVRLPLYGNDPSTGKLDQVFSARAIFAANQQLYLYLVLSGKYHRSIMDVLAEGYTMRTAILSVSLTTALAILVGLGLFFVITKPLKRIVVALRTIEQGEYTLVVDAGSDDELGELGRAINKMTGTIVSEIAAKERMDDQRRRLIARVSHDLRGPLTSVRGYLETLASEQMITVHQHLKQYVTVALQATYSLNDLIQDLFELSKLEANEKAVNLEEFSLLELAEHVRTRLEPKARMREVQVHVEPDAGSTNVEADPSLIMRVYDNLIDNAIRYCSQGGDVRITIREISEGVETSVSDTGSGIPFEDQDKIFDEFFRASNAGSDGSGLGLAIVSKILLAHGSNISVRSTLGKGSTFTFVLRKANSHSLDQQCS